MDVLKAKISEIKTERERKEGVVRRKWDGVIADLEQESIVIASDVKMAEMNQQGVGRKKER